MRTVVSVDGRITGPDEAVVSVFDRGFLYGDSVYEVLWWHRGAAIQAAEHLARLRESARRIYLDLGADDAHFLAAIARTVAASGCPADGDAYVRLVVTRGQGPIGLKVAAGLAPCVVVIVSDPHRPTEADRARGLHVALVDRLRVSVRALDPGAKTGNYMNNLLALHEAVLRGADDAVLLNDRGEVTEGTTANVYVVRGGRVRTPPIAAGILRGTTRTRVLAICRDAGRGGDEETLYPSDLHGADEVFLSSSVRGVIAVTRVDGTPVGAGVAGPVATEVHRRFEAAADAEAAAARR
ncbi:MAG: aminotransferase class IV [Planctomycetes bacterium]|nr:aminotransferase class IV [Planctomycetota bacterium]